MNYLPAVIFCGRCGIELPHDHETKCPGKPELLKDTRIGMYHCDHCCVLVLAGYKHTPVCDRCVNDE